MDINERLNARDSLEDIFSKTEKYVRIDNLDDDMKDIRSITYDEESMSINNYYWEAGVGYVLLDQEIIFRGEYL